MAASHVPSNPPSNALVEEEMMPDYETKHFHSTSPGNVLIGRYRILAKLGWGASSTVWLSKDTTRWFWHPNRYAVLKIGVSDKDAARHEINISKCLNVNPSHEGFRFVRTLLDHFEVAGPRGTHLCLAYEPMRETMKLFQQRLPDNKIPGPLLKLYMQHLLLGLDYLHTECRVVHTDLKQDNILMGLEDPAVLDDFIQAQTKDRPIPLKARKGRSIYLSQYDLGPLRSFRMLPKLVDFGLAQRLDGPENFRYPIQPPLFHAPEVILGTGWSYSADIWNFGVLIWNLLEDRNLFRDIRSDGAYDGRKHLAEMIALLGPPPKEALDRERKWSEVPWDRSFDNPKGKPCTTAREYYGGPFFNPKGEFLYGDLIPADFNLPDSVSSLEGEDKQLFLDFVSQMLQWLPEKRKTAKELLKHPWLSISS